MTEEEYTKKTLEINTKINNEIKHFKRLKTMDDKFREIYGWIDSLIDGCDLISNKMDIIEKNIFEIKKEMENVKGR